MHNDIQNHMVTSREPDVFREPSDAETNAAIDAVVDSYLAGADEHDLHTFLGEVWLDVLHGCARTDRAAPTGSRSYLDGTLRDWLYRAANRKVCGWSVYDWAVWRENH